MNYDPSYLKKLDDAIATKFLNFKKKKHNGEYYWFVKKDPICPCKNWSPTTDIVSTEVLIHSVPILVSIYKHSVPMSNSEQYKCTLMDTNEQGETFTVSASAQTIPLAVSLAVGKAASIIPA